jgi:hypothetical protein
MGIRSIVRVKEGKATLVTIYRQYDGYPSGMGDDIKKILNNGQARITNGFSGNDKAPELFNGAGCLSAYLVGQLKENKIGNTYIFPNSTKDAGQDYEYVITIDKHKHIKMKVTNVFNKKVIFNDYISEFDGEAIEKAENSVDSHLSLV